MRLLILALLLAASAVIRAAGAGADSVVTFNEIMYHPLTNEPAMEWVELYNQMTVDVDISGWRLDGGIHFFAGKAGEAFLRCLGDVVVGIAQHAHEHRES